MFISLDGVIGSPETWHFDYFDDEMGAVVGASMSQTNAMLLGRQTYDEFATRGDQSHRGLPPPRRRPGCGGDGDKRRPA